VLSGDRAQAERNRALEALRAGEAQVLVATNVAARGLDLPEVDLVVHADLPLNVEALTHRSGRTGRAGRKGTSVVIANLAERRKAERLLAAARVQCTWTAAPGATEIFEQGRARLEATLLEEAAAATEPSAGALAAAEKLGKDIEKDALILMLLGRELARVPKGERLKPVDLKVVSQDRFRPTGPPPDREEFSRDAVVFRVNLGADSRAEPGWLLPLICRRGGVTRRDVGAIRVGPQYSEFEISGEAASDFTLAASQPDPRAPNVRIERSERSAGHERRPSRPERSPAHERSPHPARSQPSHPRAAAGEASRRPVRAPSFVPDQAVARPVSPHGAAAAPPPRDTTRRPARPLLVGGHQPLRRSTRPVEAGGYEAPRRSTRPLDFCGDTPRRTPRPQAGLPPWKSQNDFKKDAGRPSFAKKRS
jgi:ATP-dependent RNA helicase DeaD